MVSKTIEKCVTIVKRFMSFIGNFQSETYGSVTLDQLILHIKDFLQEMPKSEYSLVIGTDSQERIDAQSREKQIQLITAIVVHRKGWGGRYFWQKRKIKAVSTLREKIYAETLSSLELAYEFVPKIKIELIENMPKYYLEIHVDVGEQGKTREMIKEVVGMISGNGFIVKTKPYAYAASYVADKHT